MKLICDYNHYADHGGLDLTVAAEVLTPDTDGKWTPLCGACVPEFWSDEDLPSPFLLFPIDALAIDLMPASSLRIKKVSDR